MVSKADELFLELVDLLGGTCPDDWEETARRGLAADAVIGEGDDLVEKIEASPYPGLARAVELDLLKDRAIELLAAMREGDKAICH